jgi:tyrosine-protein phosphatase SIW14
MKIIKHLNTILLVLGLCSFVNNDTRPKSWAKEISIPHLHNTFLVTNEIYRGAQPSKKGFYSLDSIGIKSVLNLRNILNDNKEAKHSKQQLIHLKINTWTINYKELVEGVKLLHQAPKPVFVHCKHGSDRTGCIVAGYRIAIQDWTIEEAIDEFKNGGFGFHEKWFQNIIVLLKSIDKTKFKQDVLSQK